MRRVMADPCAGCEPSHRICRPCAIKARLRAAKLERLIVKAGPSIAAIAKSYHLYPDFVQTIRPLIAASARIAKRKAAARLARRGKP